MEQHFIDLVTQKLNVLYQEIKALLFAQDSYVVSVDTKNVELYFCYLEASLELPYNRIYSVSNFTACEDYQVSDRMYPFALLKLETKQKIKDILKQGISFADTLQVSGIDKDYHLLSTEKHLEGLRK